MLLTLTMTLLLKLVLFFFTRTLNNDSTIFTNTVRGPTSYKDHIFFSIKEIWTTTKKA